MKFEKLPLNGAYIVETSAFHDDRGKFARLFCQNDLNNIHCGNPINQINYSLTAKKGAVRGMHFQYPPKAEIKMVRCLKGKIFDVIVDLRKKSATFLQWYAAILSEENMRMLYIPKGFAHGFQTLEDNCELLYLHTEFYSSEHESGLRYDDKCIAIQWPLEVAEISQRDLNHSLLSSDFSGIEL